MLPIVDTAVALRVVDHRYVTLKSILSLLMERAKYQTMYIKMILRKEWQITKKIMSSNGDKFLLRFWLEIIKYLSLCDHENDFSQTTTEVYWNFWWNFVR